MALFLIPWPAAGIRPQFVIRMALGVQGVPNCSGLVIRQGMGAVVVGLAAGVGAVALVLRESIVGLLFGVQPVHPLTITGVAVVLLVVGILPAGPFPPVVRRAQTSSRSAATRVTVSGADGLCALQHSGAAGEFPGKFDSAD